ncbi:SIR2 family NAD-dependent protein deacylase [Alsobacter sp. R-9]
MLGEARRIVAFTGAGISTESGVPDFRSPGSPWTANRPIPFDQYLASAAARAEAWRRKFTMDDLYRGARPNRGHMALVDLHRQGRLRTVITQNIDNLHQESGLPGDAIVELHGNGTYATCLSCDLRHELPWVRETFERSGVPPACSHCGGIVKSATISFGQAMPEEAMRRAFEAVDACDLFLVLGSSLVVQPAARLPALAKARGAVLVIVNRDPTPLDHHADLVVRGGIGDALAGLGASASGG